MEVKHELTCIESVFLNSRKWDRTFLQCVYYFFSVFQWSLLVVFTLHNNWTFHTVFNPTPYSILTYVLSPFKRYETGIVYISYTIISFNYYTNIFFVKLLSLHKYSHHCLTNEHHKMCQWYILNLQISR